MPNLYRTYSFKKPQNYACNVVQNRVSRAKKNIVEDLCFNRWKFRSNRFF